MNKFGQAKTTWLIPAALGSWRWQRSRSGSGAGRTSRWRCACPAPTRPQAANWAAAPTPSSPASSSAPTASRPISPARGRSFAGQTVTASAPETEPRARLAGPREPRELWAWTSAKDTPARQFSTGASISWTTTATRSKTRSAACRWRTAVRSGGMPIRSPVKRNHGMSRTVPAVTDKLVVAMGPKCHVVCLDAVTGELRWGLDLVRQYGATVPPWYAGQCPLIDNGAVILAPGGKDALLLAVRRPDRRGPLADPQSPRLEDDPFLGDADGVRRPAHVRLLRQQRRRGRVGQGRHHSLGNHGLENQHRHRAFAADSERRADLSHRRLQRRQPHAAAPQGRRPFVPQTLFKLEPEVFGATQHTPVFWAAISMACAPTANSSA